MCLDLMQCETRSPQTSSNVFFMVLLFGGWGGYQSTYICKPITQYMN